MNTSSITKKIMSDGTEVLERFRDNANTFIIAMDFDGTITTSNVFPHFGTLRKYAKEVINLLHDIGVTVIIWTCRDHEDIEGTKQFLQDHGIKFSAFNTVIEYAPFKYESRKIYAHMYVDDSAYGWDDTDEDIMLNVLYAFMTKKLGVQTLIASVICGKIKDGKEVDVEYVKSCIY